MPVGLASSFYGRGDFLPAPIHPPPESDNNQMMAMLQSMSMTLSDVQGQLSVFQDQSRRHDDTLCRLESEVKELKATKRSNEVEESTPKSKRQRRGLSVRYFKLHICNLTYVIQITVGMCAHSTFFF